MFEFGLVVTFLIVLVIVALVGFFFWGLKHAVLLAVNSIIGYFALYALNAFHITSLTINLWSVLLVALFGIFGLILVLLLHWVGVAF